METITTIYNALCEREEDKATVAEVRKAVYRYVIPGVVVIILSCFTF